MELTLGVEPTQRPVIECPLVAFREPTGALRALGNGVLGHPRHLEAILGLPGAKLSLKEMKFNSEKGADR